MWRWIRLTIIILAFAAGAYWFLQREGVRNCGAIGGQWDYERWACDSG